MNRKPYAIALVLCLSSGLVLADQITLKNGDRVTGKVTKADEKTVIVKTESMGDVTISRAAIASLVTEEPLHVEMQGKSLLATVETTSEKEVRVKPTEAEAITAPVESVTAIRNDALQKAYLREVERTQHPRLNDFWKGFISFSLAGASGNSRTASYSTAAAASRIAGKNKMALYFNQVYATQSTVEPHGATASRISGGYRIDRDLSKRLFLFGTTDFDYDKFLGLDLRSVFGGGLGVHVWKSDRGFLDLGAGAVWNREKFSEGLVRNSGELLFNQEWGYTVLNRLKLSERIALYPNLTETGEYRVNFDLVASMPIYKWLEWNIGFSNRYLTNPPVGRRTNDLLYTTGIRFSFDQTTR